MLSTDPRTSEIFSVVRDIPLNYVERASVDDTFVESLTSNKHVVIYAASKQGKTCLRKKWLSEDRRILVQCSHRTSLAGLQSDILKQAGYMITQSIAKTQAGRYKIRAQLGGKILGFLSAEVGGGS